MGPLFLPPGSIRGIIALSIVLGSLTMCFKGITIPEVFATSLGLVIGLYFRDSSSQDVQKDNDALKEELKALKDKVAVIVPSE
jgi:hypothetical protein